MNEFKEHLITDTDHQFPDKNLFTHSEAGIVVLKNYRFHKQLSIELYKAPTTKAGKLKNPLTMVNPFDAVLHAAKAEEIKFFSAVSRFQNNPTEGKSPSALEALKLILKNPLGLRFFYHDPDFSMNVVAGSLEEVAIGETITDLALTVNRKNDVYEILPSIKVNGTSCPFNKLGIKYEYFLLINKTLHLLGNFQFLKIVKFFGQHPSGIRLHESKYREFKQQILEKLEDVVTIHYTEASTPTKTQAVQIGFTNSLEKLIYLSDNGQYVLINPVMKYGELEIPVLSKKQIYANDANGKVFLFERNEEAEIGFTALLLKQHPDFEDQLENDLTYFYLHKQQFLDEDWFLNAFHQWQNEGITILGFNQLKGNKINGHKAKVTIQVTSGINWFNTELNVRFGKKKAGVKQLLQSVRNKSRFVQLDDGTLGILPEEWLEKFADYFSIAEIEGENLRTPKISFSALRKMYDEEVLDEAVKSEVDFYTGKLARFKSMEAVDVPDELHATLREYQKQGLAWLNFLDDYRFGGCMADDMGLGKTLQVIAFILLQRKKIEKNTNLIVVPTSLIFNWQAEIQKFAPSIKVCTLYGSSRISGIKDFDEHEVVLTSYGTLLSDVGHLRKYFFNYIFLDEAQNIKSIESQRYHAVCQLQAKNRITITGTPVENNTLDLYAQLSFSCPGLLGNKQSFKALFSIPIDKFKNSKRAKELQQKIAPFVLRRTKKEVAGELPEKTEMVLYCPMGDEQRKVYDAYEKEFREFISSKTEDDLSKNSMLVLKGLTRLRQICNSPLLLEDEKLYGDSSSKIEVLMEQIQNNSQTHKILIFSQFVSMLELIKTELQDNGIGYEYLTGSTKNRETVVNNFQNNKEIRVFLISLKAGGTGLNLTEADYVYLVDPWWNPAVENQAIDRSYRIGQKKNVVAVRLICPDTLEGKIIELQKAKKSLSEDLIKTDGAFFKSITKSDWLSLLKG